MRVKSLCLLALTALFIATPFAEACGKKGGGGEGGPIRRLFGRRCGGGGQSSDGGDSAYSSGCSTCGQASFAPTGFGNCATCTPSSSTVPSLAASPAIPFVAYEWHYLPDDHQHALLFRGNVMLGVYDFSCNCYSTFSNGQFSPRGAPLPPTVQAPSRRRSEATVEDRKNISACLDCKCGCKEGAPCQCTRPPQDSLAAMMAPAQDQLASAVIQR